MVNSELRLLFLRATGGIQEQSLEGQKTALDVLLRELELIRNDVEDKLRVEHAQKTASGRLKPTNSHWAVHMIHCYGMDQDSIYEWEEFGKDDAHAPIPYRHGCKYGEDDICPAAMYEEPYDEFVKWQTEQKGT